MILTYRLLDMKNRISLTSVILTICCLLCKAQTGPGGIETTSGSGTLSLWLDANQGVMTTGTAVDSWNDQSGYVNNAIQNTAGFKPTLVNNTLNGYPIVTFDGTNDVLSISDASSLDLTNWSFIIIGKVNLHKNFNAFFVKGNDFQENYEFLTNSPSTGNIHYPILFNTPIRLQFGETDYMMSTTVFDMYQLDYNQVNLNLYQNNTLTQSDSETRTPQTNASALLIGNEAATTGRFLNGSIAELIIFSSQISLVERTILNNSLAAKYNISLATNDLYVQDNSANGNYDHNVAGIGQATDGSSHTDSRGTGIVTINTPSALSNGDYLFWGEDIINPTYSFVSDPTNYTEQLSSKWRVSKVNDLGTVTVSFDITGIDLSGRQSCQPLQLVIDNNNDFSSPSNTYDLTIVGNTATANNVSFSDGDYFTLRYLDQIVWDGTSFFNGSGAGNAPNDSDDCLKLLIKPSGTGVLNADAHVREVEIESGATLNVSDGILLEVENQLEINGLIDLLGEAQLIQNHTGTTSNSGSGSLKAYQQGTSNMFNYNYWSSPVNTGGTWQISALEDSNGVINFHTEHDADPNTTPITLSNFWLYDFNAVSEEYSGWNALSTTDGLSPGRGYTMKGSGATGSEQEYIFRGIPNDGNYSYSVTAGNDFLIGNPYPSALDADQFINDNLSIIDGTLYFWEHFTSNSSHALADYEGGYATYNLMMGVAAVADNSGLTSGEGTASKPAPTEHITVGQGFFVTIENAGNLVFNNQQRAFARESSNETTFYRNMQSENVQNSDNRTKIWFTFEDPNDHVRSIGLGYDSDHGSYNYDRGYDAKAYDDQRNELYWILDSQRLAIQALSHINIDDQIQLGIKVTDVGSYTFGIADTENLPSDITIFLKDELLNTYHNLRQSDHIITLDQNTTEERFKIVFQEPNSLSVDTHETINSLSITYDNETELIKLNNISPDAIRRLSIFNSIGQNVYTQTEHIRLSTDIGVLPTGIYIIKVETVEAQKSFKFIKH